MLGMVRVGMPSGFCGELSHPCAQNAQEWGSLGVVVSALKKRRAGSPLKDRASARVSAVLGFPGPSVVVRWEQQVPHRAFSPVRNDKGLFGVSLRGAERLLFFLSLAAFCRLWRGRSPLRLRSGRALGPLVKARAFGMTPRCVGRRPLTAGPSTALAFASLRSG